MNPAAPLALQVILGSTPAVTRWAQQIAAADAFVVVSPE